MLMRLTKALLLSLALLSLISCDRGRNGNEQPPGITISISPASTTVPVNGTVQFTATVRNAADTAVTWLVNEIQGGDATVGIISSSGLYTAPAVVPSPAEVTVKAVSAADPTKSASATVTIAPRVTVTPAAVTVPAGGTQQFTVTVEGVSDTAVTWKVDGTTGGNATLGTISSDGLYSAPLAPPPSGVVTVAAVPRANPNVAGTAEVTVTFSNATLNGRYAFVFSGIDGENNLYVTAGTVQADGNGLFSDGIRDLNALEGVFPALTVSGDYSLGADGRGMASLTDSEGNTAEFRLVAISHTRAEMIQFDLVGHGWGIMEKQDPSAFDPSALSGGYAFRFEGVSEQGAIMVVGRFTANGAGAIGEGMMDSNDMGTIIQQSIFDGSYKIAGSGRGEVTFNTPSGPATFAFYVISPQRSLFVSLDYVPAFAGIVEQQQAVTFSNASLTGSYAFLSSGLSTLGFVGTVGRFYANGAGSISSGVFDQNDYGYLSENIPYTGTYLIGANGRGQMTFDTSLGSSSSVFYMVSPEKAVFLPLDPSFVVSGEAFRQQGSPFSNAAVAGSYGLLLTEALAVNVAAQMSVSSPGNLEGTADVDAWDELLADLPFTATYSVSSNGRSLVTLTTVDGSSDFRVYLVSRSKLLFLGLDELLAGFADKQF